MNRQSILAGMFSAATLSVLVGTVYIIDCRRSGGEVDKCWLTGAPFMGLGGAAGGAFQLGYETLNPRLRKDDAPPGARRFPTDPDA
jgi:hypothetical protein